MPTVVRGDVMQYDDKTFAGYLAALRAQAIYAANDTVSNATVLALVQSEQLASGLDSVKYQYLGDDANGDPVFRLGTKISLQDLKSKLDALVAAGSLKTVAGADFAYTAVPGIR